MGAITDRLTIDLERVKLYLKIDNDEEDDVITEMVDAAKDFADNFCNNLFTDDDTEDGTPLDIPPGVRSWCMGFVARLYEHRGNGLTQSYPRDLAQEVWGPIDERQLAPYRYEPGF